jgi:hypothetical protein
VPTWGGFNQRGAFVIISGMARGYRDSGFHQDDFSGMSLFFSAGSVQVQCSFSAGKSAREKGEYRREPCTLHPHGLLPADVYRK